MVDRSFVLQKKGVDMRPQVTVRVSRYAQKQRQKQQGTWEPPAQSVTQDHDEFLAPSPSVVTGGSGNKPPRFHFCAGLIVEKRPVIGWAVLAVIDERFQQDRKMPGGTNEHSLGDGPIRTLKREVAEEANVKPENVELVHEWMTGDRTHIQYFYAVRSYTGTPKIGGPFPDRGNMLFVRWVSLADFMRRCFKSYRIGFYKGVALLAREQAETGAHDLADAVRALGIPLQ